MLAQVVALYMAGVRAALLVRQAAVEVTVREAHANVAAVVNKFLYPNRSRLVLPSYLRTHLSTDLPI